VNPWLSFVKRRGKAAASEYAFLDGEGSLPLQVFLGQGRAKRLFFFTKDTLLRRLFDSGWSIPRGWVIFQRRGILPETHISYVSRQVKQLRLPLFFVGDLSPIDLTTFEMLRRGSAVLTATKRHLPVMHAGINDRWLALCERYRRPMHSRGPTTLEMGPIESEHLRVLIALTPDLPNIIGRRSFDLLRSARALHVEAVSGAADYGDEFPLVIADHLSRLRAGTLSGRAPTARRRSPPSSAPA